MQSAALKKNIALFPTDLFSELAFTEGVFSVARLIKLVQSSECHNKAKRHLN